MSASSHNGLLLLNKQPGFTSFDSLNIVKKTFSTGKVGHTGTLDKFASGLLLVLVGPRAVKLNSLFVGLSKEYTGTVFFGAETDTLDPEGAVVAEGKVPSREQVEAALAGFRGDILQTPPAYSALHIGGRRAHELAREGKQLEIKQRPVKIFELELLSWTPPEAKIHVLCSSGTYIRSLARDIAMAAGSRAHLSYLNRSGVGPFRLGENVSEGQGKSLSESLLPLDSKLFETLSLPCFFLDEPAAKGFAHGRPLDTLPTEGNPAVNFGGEMANFAGVFRKSEQCQEAELLGVLENRDGKWAYAYVFPNR